MTGEPVYSPEALVATLYRALLRREPDPEGAATYAAALRGGRDFRWLMQVFLDSDEYQSLLGERGPPPAFPLDRAPPMTMDTDWDPTEHQALWDHIGRVWSRYGETDPHWSVITDDRFRAESIADVGNMEAFQQSGQADVERLDAWLVRNGLSAQGVCAEYGCGVGRVTTALARRFERVIGFDISAPHLDVARAQVAAVGARNVDLVQVRSPADLRQLAGVDLFYSVIVLQHNPPPVIVDILDHAFAGLNPGGVAWFQLPTYGAGYSFTPQSYRAAMGATTEMEIHFLPQRMVFELAERRGLSVVEVQPDDWTGNSAHWISTTFLLTKPGSSATKRAV